MVDFLGHLPRHLPDKLLVLWDHLPQHRAWMVMEFIATTQGRLVTECLPSYAPELNPVEYLWVTGKSTNCLTSAPPTWPNSAAGRRAACAGARRLVRSFRKRDQPSL